MRGQLTIKVILDVTDRSALGQIMDATQTHIDKLVRDTNGVQPFHNHRGHAIEMEWDET